MRAPTSSRRLTGLQPIRVALIEDQAATRHGLAAILHAASLEVAGEYGSMEEALPAMRSTPPDVVLCDIGLPGQSGVEGVRQMHQEMPGLPVLMLTVHDADQLIFEAICAGACGYLLKDTEPERLAQCIREVYAGGAPMSPEVARKMLHMLRDLGESPPAARSEPAEPDLSPRQSEVLHLLATGNSYKACADILGVSIDTIRFHVRKMYDRLHVNSRSEAVAKVFGLQRRSR